MNLKSNQVLFTLIIVLSAFNIFIQSFDFIHFNFSPKGFYRFEPNEDIELSLLLNKFIRLALNLVILKLVQTALNISNKSQFIYLYFLIFGLAILDIFLIQGSNFILEKCHEFVHPLAFTPLIPFAVWVVNAKKVAQ
ncbi:MAG: hypothetical protein K9I36_12740 [Bacteroidia bacterium]|nr:hypothetical protein [Bacteroidia bacterium]MCF8427596.1 hypothetical protein [Bacteroidia bacterium]